MFSHCFGSFRFKFQSNLYLIMMVPYSIENCFYLLSLFMVDCVYMNIEYLHDHCVMQFHDCNKPQEDCSPLKTTVIFFPDMIHYIFHGCTYIVKGRTLDYFYYLMALTREPWMHQVLEVVRNTPPTLINLSNKATLGTVEGESMLRNMLTSTTTLLKQRIKHGRSMSTIEYSDQVKEICATHSNICYVNHKDKETIYMHHFHFLGDFSELLNLTSLSHLLAIESILEPAHTWEEIYTQIYYCQIENFTMVLWRARWCGDIEFSIYLDMELLDLCKDPWWPKSVSPLMTQMTEMYDIAGHVESSFAHWFVLKYMVSKYPLKMHTLKDLSKFQLGVNVFIKRLHTFSKCALTPLDMNMPEIVENSDQFLQIMDKCKQFLISLTDVSSWSCTAGGVVYATDPFTQEDVKSIWRKGTHLPLEVQLDFIKHNDAFRQFGLMIGWQQLDQLRGIFTEL